MARKDAVIRCNIRVIWLIWSSLWVLSLLRCHIFPYRSARGGFARGPDEGQSMPHELEMRVRSQIAYRSVGAARLVAAKQCWPQKNYKGQTRILLCLRSAGFKTTSNPHQLPKTKRLPHFVQSSLQPLHFLIITTNNHLESFHQNEDDQRKPQRQTFPFLSSFQAYFPRRRENLNSPLTSSHQLQITTALMTLAALTTALPVAAPEPHDSTASVSPRIPIPHNIPNSFFLSSKTKGKFSVC